MSEIREYLAAKAICKMDSAEYVLYDLAVHSKFHTFYPNWLYILRHICYIKPEIMVNVFPLINREKGISQSLIDLLRFVNVERLTEQERARLFKEVFYYYQYNAIYVTHSYALQFFVNAYVSHLNSCLLQPIKINEEQLENDRFRIANLAAIVGDLFESGALSDDELKTTWLEYADELVTHKHLPLVVNTVFGLWNRMKAYEKMNAFINNTNGFNNLPTDLQNSFFNHACYCGFEYSDYLKLIIDKAFGEEDNSYAVHACLHIDKPEHISSIYKTLFSKEENIRKFFNPNGSLSILYSRIVEQFKILSDTDKYAARTYYIKFLICAVKNTYYFGSFDYLWISDLIKDAMSLYGQELISEWTILSCLDWDFTDFLAHIETSVISEDFIESITNNISEDKCYLRDRALYILLHKLEDSGLAIPKQYEDTYQKKKDEKLALGKENADRIKQKKEVLHHDLHSENRFVQLKAIKKIIKSDNSEVPIDNEDKKKIVDVLVEELTTVDLDNFEIIRNENSYSLKGVDVVWVFKMLEELFTISPESILQFRLLVVKLAPCQWMLMDKSIVCEIISQMIKKTSPEEMDSIIEWWSKRKDSYMMSDTATLTELSLTLHTTAFVPILEAKVIKYIKAPNLDNRLDALNAIDAFAGGVGNKEQKYFEDILAKITFNEETSDLWYKVNGVLISKFLNENALEQRFEHLKVPISYDMERIGWHSLSIDEAELNHPTRFDCFMSCKQPDWIPYFMQLIEYAIEKAHKDDMLCMYAKVLVEQSARYILLQNEEDCIRDIIEKVNSCKSEKVKFILLPVVQGIIDMFLNTTKQESIHKTLRIYNNVHNKIYAGIQNEHEFISLVQKAINAVKSTIEYEGYYSEMNKPILEDQIQKSVKIMLEKELTSLGVPDITIIREAALYDNKRIDILIKCAFLPPIIVELKRLHNEEITSNKVMKDYKTKFMQYYNAIHACHSWYWVFKVESDRNKKHESKYNEMKDYYSDIASKVCFELTDCCKFTDLHHPENTNKKNSNLKNSRKRKHG